MINSNETNDKFQLSRRNFLIGSVGVSLLMAFSTMSGQSNTLNAKKNLASKIFSPNVWFEINEGGEVLINIAKAEIGQHIGTALARIVADELGADWNKVSIVHVDTDPKWGYMETGGSWSVFHSFTPLSQAGAAGRIALIEAGSVLLGKKVKECEVINGYVKSGEKSISFGDIVSKGQINRTFTVEELALLPVKSARNRQLIGKETLALDIPAKTNGMAQYGIDVEIDGMIYSRPIVPPCRYGNSITEVNDKGASNIPGYLGYEILSDPSETLQGWVCVLATSYYSAIKAGDAIVVSYNKSPATNVSEKQIQTEGEKLTRDKNSGKLFINEGNVDQANLEAKTHLEASYRTASVLHFPLEPVNATVEFIGDICHIHTGSQWQSLTIPLIAKALGVTQDKIVMHQYYLGGGFGRKLFGDYIIPAVLTAKALRKPIKLVFTREDDSRFTQPRSPSVQLFNASLDSENNVTGIEHTFAAGWPTLAMAPQYMIESLDKKGMLDPFSSNGADHWYTLDNHKARAINNELAQDTFLPGWMRSVGPGWLCWGVESFMDEIATATKKDPIDFRLSLLDGCGKNAGVAPVSTHGALRLANVLKKVKSQSGWKKSLGENEGMGVAISSGQERSMPTWIACVAHVHVNKLNGIVTVKKLSLTVDCGAVIHPDGALAQVESGVLWGLSLALHEGNEVKQGQISKTNLDTYTPLRMSDVPELDIQFIESDEVAVGLGEPGVVTVAPAIANAIYQAVDVRLRHLPMRPDDIIQAINI